MPAIQPPGEVSAGLAAQPLVTSATPVVTPNAVSAMTEAFRSGFLTTEDILSRIGPVGQAKKKAELTLATEVASPDAVAARTQGYQAQAAQAKLQGAQATAGLPLVQPSANLAGQEIAAKASLLPAQTSLTAQQLELNSQFMYPKALYDIATERLKPAQTLKRVDAHGAEFTQMLNAAGEDVTPGSQAHQTYSNIAQKAFLNLGQGRGQPSAPAQPSVAPAAAPAASLAEPGFSPVSEAAPVDQQRADLLKSGKYDMHEVNALTDADVVGTHKALVRFLGAAPGQAVTSPTVTPKVQAPTVEPISPVAAPAAPVVEPVNPPGIQTGLSKNFMSSADIGTDLRKQKSYEQWDSQKGFANAFESTVHDIKSATPGEPMNTLDMSLAENVIKMFDPTATIRSFKWEKMEEGQPLKERMKNWQQELFRTGVFTPEARDRLMKIGYEQIMGREKGVVPHLQFAASRAQQAGVPVETVLNPDELRVLQGTPFGALQSTPPAAAPQGKMVTIPGLGTGTVDANGIFTRTQ